MQSASAGGVAVAVSEAQRACVTRGALSLRPDPSQEKARQKYAKQKLDFVQKLLKHKSKTEAVPWPARRRP